MIKLSRASPAALAICAATLCACAMQPDSSDPAVQLARTAWQRGDFSVAATDYQQAALNAPPFAGNYLLLAAEAALKGHDAARADAILGRIRKEALDPHQFAHFELLTAQSAWARGNAPAVLAALPAQINDSDNAYADSMWLLRARALASLGDGNGAVQALVAREAYLTADALAVNRTMIWGELTAPSVPIRSLAIPSGVDPVTRGWLELGNLARDRASLAQLDAWRQRYPAHPGQAQLANLMAGLGPGTAAGPDVLVPPGTVSAPPYPIGAAAASGLGGPSMAAVNPFAVPHRGGPVVLLLPTSGPQMALSVPVRDGFTAVAAAQIEDTQGTPEGAVAAYRRAAASGAGEVIGPLRKEDAVAIAALGTLPIPVLSLNFLDSSTPAPPGLWQFGLAPEDEAVAAADDAAGRGLRRAIILVPDSDWGEHLRKAFEDRFVVDGGSVVDAGRYSAGTQDFSAPIKSLLKIDASNARFSAMVSTLGFKPEFEPQARDDIDVIFIGARVPQARLIAPQLRFWRAQRIPLYATSAANDGSGDFDRAGIRFCDVPALVHGESGRSADVVRLDALGRDAAALSAALRQGRLAPEFSIEGATGVLSVDRAGVVHRQLSCTEIASGAPRTAPPPQTSPQ